MRRVLWAAACILVHTITHAATVQFTLSGSRPTPSYMQDAFYFEAFGNRRPDAEYAWRTTARPGPTGQQELIDHMVPAMQAFADRFSRATATFSYDTAQVAPNQFIYPDLYRGSASGYQVSTFAIDLVGPEPLGLVSESTRASTFNSTSIVGLSVGRDRPTSDGAIPGSPGIPIGVAPAEFRFELGDFLVTSNVDFDLSAMPTWPLPVRLTAPSDIKAVGMFFDMTWPRDGRPLDLSLPSSIDTQSIQGYGSRIDVIFDAVFDIRLDRGDYATSEEFESARDWVTANLRQFNLEMDARFEVTDVRSVAEVPEPATWALAGLGLALLSTRARRRVSAAA